MVWRLTEDCRWLGLLEGSCVSEDKFKQVYYTDKALFEPITEEERKGLISYDDDVYCLAMGIEVVLFYTQNELKIFLSKI